MQYVDLYCCNRYSSQVTLHQSKNVHFQKQIIQFFVGSNEYWLFNYFRKNGIHHSFNNWNHRFPIIPEQKHHAVAMRPLRVKLLLYNARNLLYIQNVQNCMYLLIPFTSPAKIQSTIPRAATAIPKYTLKGRGREK